MRRETEVESAIPDYAKINNSEVLMEFKKEHAYQYIKVEPILNAILSSKITDNDKLKLIDGVNKHVNTFFYMDISSMIKLLNYVFHVQLIKKLQKLEKVLKSEVPDELAMKKKDRSRSSRSSEESEEEIEDDEIQKMRYQSMLLRYTQFLIQILS